MPTIEIISVNATKIPKLPKFSSFAYIAEDQLISHRGLFQDVLNKEKGIIVHLANKDLEGEEEGGWFAGLLMEWGNEDEESEPIKFEKHRLEDLKHLNN